MKYQEELIKRATLAREKAYAPYSQFKVGAALLCEDGSIYTGCNIENASFGLTCCAERVAIFNAIAEGKKKFKAICIALSCEEGSPSPCGACRQVIFEFGMDIEVITINVFSQKITVESISELMPRGFKLSAVEKTKRE
ncbi:cytidine deaminase [Candidatus Uabimicrobium amorphum]|uniref:Cytidine deaminase n=1 Tax=Uabimicrobium amorphum TaxID=2596890 RepID=A0A5S9IJN9_UABAM|nr:cytidine deaminase [Candidatus Uabimicrobium amorphum]BBM83119.1 cytidine deaminase [Candidatus Uabimicrobium amorphum]